MFYVANVITLSVVSELLWKFTLLVRYKLNIFRPPRVKQFDICALLFVGDVRFKPLYEMVFYGYWKALPSGSLSMLHVSLTLFPLCIGFCCSLFNYPLIIILIDFSAACVYIIALVAETILSPRLLNNGETIYCDSFGYTQYLGCINLV